jgi:hypothetical protein
VSICPRELRVVSIARTAAAFLIKAKIESAIGSINVDAEVGYVVKAAACRAILVAKILLVLIWRLLLLLREMTPGRLLVDDGSVVVRLGLIRMRERRMARGRVKYGVGRVIRLGIHG